MVELVQLSADKNEVHRLGANQKTLFGNQAFSIFVDKIWVPPLKFGKICVPLNIMLLKTLYKTPVH